MDKRRKFSREFKLAAVKKVMEQGLSYTVVARDLGVGDNLIRIGRSLLRKMGLSQPRSLVISRLKLNSNDFVKRTVSSKWNATF